MMTRSVNISSKKSLYFNELARFGQFIEYTLFRSPFLLPKVPIWSPFHSKSGPHFEKLRSPSHVGAVTLILSVFSYIVFTFLYSHIVVYVHFLPGPKTQGILCQGSLVCCFVKNGGDNNVVICCWMLSVFSYIVFICLYFHIFVLCISISVSFCCFLIFCIFRFFVPLVHGARDCLLLWTPFKKNSPHHCCQSFLKMKVFRWWCCRMAPALKT